MKPIIQTIAKYLLKILYIFPVNNQKIFLRSFYDQYTTDMKALGSYIKEKYPEKVIYCGCISLNGKREEKINFIVEKSLKGIYHLLTSKYIIFPITEPKGIPFRESQILIDTWHGNGIKASFGLSKEHFSRTNYFLSSSKQSDDLLIKGNFFFSGEILKFGVPRNDVFFNPVKSKDISRIVKEYYGVENKKIVLFAPTFRKDFKNFDYGLDGDRLLSTLKKKFGGDWVLFFRLHPSIQTSANNNSDFIINVSSYSDMQELLLASDILITDYSSSPWDFGLKNKPIFIFATDLDEYRKSDRGFLFSIDELPYPKASTNDELVDNIKTFNEKAYKENLKKYYITTGSYEKGESCEKLCKYLFER